MKQLKLTFAFCLLSLILIGQAFAQQSNQGSVRGNFQMDVQAYFPDSAIGITESKLEGQQMGMNAFANVIYSIGNFTAGVRYEAFLKPLVGYDDAWEGHGIAHRYVSYSTEKFEFTAGNFYDQFGNGMIFRSYEEWSLGYDNAMDGVKIKFSPSTGITLKGVYGIQRYYWKSFSEEPKKRGIVRGIDGEFYLNDIFHAISESKLKVMLGGSAVSKYEKDDPTVIEYKMPENVAAYSGRMNISYGKFGIDGEYARKINDPSELNNYIYRPGQALLLTGRFSQKGLGVILSAKYIDNMYFKSRRTETLNALDINFLPPIAKQHAYSLFAMYPYATQPNGEMGIAGQVVYTIPKKTKLGGKYGTTLSLDYSSMSGINKSPLEGTSTISEKGTYGYEADFFKFGETDYFEDYTIEISRKTGSKTKVIAGFTHQKYNFDVIEEGIESGHEIYTINAGVLDLTYKLTSTKALRLELQYLSTRQDSGNWAAALLEYTIAPKWFFSVQDEYNFNNPASDNTYHYYNFAMGFVDQTTRIALSYGRQREGILCVGGVCRNVPAASGLTLTITSSF